MSTLQQLKSWIDAKSTGEHHRQLLVIELPIPETLSVLQIIAQHYEHVYCISDEVSAHSLVNGNELTTPDIKHYQQYLGKQIDALIYDIRNGIDLNAFYAFSGMVNAKGIIVLCDAADVSLPQHQHGRTQNNIQEKKHLTSQIKFSYGQQIHFNYFKHYLKTQLKHPSVAHISTNNLYLPSSMLDKVTRSKQRSAPFADNITAPITITLSPLQISILNSIVEDLMQAPNKYHCKVILGERGRGKSTLLGNIAAHLELSIRRSQQTLSTCVITCALRKSQLLMCNTTYLEAMSVLENTDHLKHTYGPLAHYPPDEIMHNAPPNSIVLIDEMASIAPKLLRQIVGKFKHVVMTGTTHGYEGSGKGFMLRVLPFLSKLHSAQVFKLNQPFRWFENDPVETMLDSIVNPQASHSQILALTSYKIDTAFGQLPQASTDYLATIEYLTITKQQLTDNLALSSQIFNLLSYAHYQTTPNDLVRIMDAPDCHIFVACKHLDSPSKSVQVIAVATVFEEGGPILSSVAHAISLGKRRVQGHLTAQALTLHLLDEAICQLQFLRVNRIAVADHFKHLSIGSKLLSCINDYASAHDFDGVSTSFGYTRELGMFWQANSFIVAKLGQRIDTSSGTASILMLKPCSYNLHAYLASIQVKLHIDLAYYRLVYPDIFTIYTDLLLSNTKVVGNERSIFYNRAASAYKEDDIGFNKIDAILLDCLQQNFSDEIQPLLDMFMQSQIKGLHQHERIARQHNFINALFHQFPDQFGSNTAK